MRGFFDSVPNTETQDARSETTRALESMDMATLRNLFEERTRRAGSDEAANVIDPSAIAMTQSKHGFGEYKPEEDTLEMSVRAIADSAVQNKLNPGVHATKWLIHEEIHAVSRDPVPHRDGFLKERVMGYQVNRRFRSPLFHFFNEGVTEKMSWEMLREYARSSGNVSEADTQEYLETIQDDEHRDAPYTKLVELVDAFCERIGKEVGLPADQIWTSVANGMFAHERLDDPELGELAENILPQSMLDELGTLLESPEAFERVINNLRNSKSHDLSVAEQIRSWLQRADKK